MYIYISIDPHIRFYFVIYVNTILSYSICYNKQAQVGVSRLGNGGGSPVGRCTTGGDGTDETPYIVNNNNKQMEGEKSVVKNLEEKYALVLAEEILDISQDEGLEEGISQRLSLGRWI